MAKEGAEMDTTLEHHVKGLRRLLKYNHPCVFCPEDTAIRITHSYFPVRCVVCRAFVGLTTQVVRYADGSVSQCPCCVLGEKESIRRTWIALEHGGWLDKED